MLFPEDFARRAGCSELVFERLSIQEFVVGTIRIILQGGISEEEKVARLSHLLELMILATDYNWPPVRAMYGAALGEIERGFRQWSDKLNDLKEEMLKPTDVMVSSSTRPGKAKDQFCKAYNWGREGCSRGDSCNFLHVCEDCAKKRGKREEQHKGTCRMCPQRENKESASKN